MENNSKLMTLKHYSNYIIIGVVSLLTLVFLPMLGSTVGLAWNIPNTVVGWIVWVATKLIVAALNVLIFHCFMQQGIENSKEHPNYIEARRILMTQDKKEVKPRSPLVWNLEQYGKKGVTIFFASALSVFAFTQAILSFDVIMMLTYAFTIIMGLIFGVMQMKTAEDYWTYEYLEYAQYYAKGKETSQQYGGNLNHDNT